MAENPFAGFLGSPSMRSDNSGLMGGLGDLLRQPSTPGQRSGMTPMMSTGIRTPQPPQVSMGYSPPSPNRGSTVPMPGNIGSMEIPGGESPSRTPYVAPERAMNPPRAGSTVPRPGDRGVMPTVEDEVRSKLNALRRMVEDSESVLGTGIRSRNRRRM